MKRNPKIEDALKALEVEVKVEAAPYCRLRRCDLAPTASLVLSLGSEDTNRKLLETASDPSHFLHHYFEWDESEAGQKWRLRQASEIIRTMDIFLKGPDGAELRAKLKPGVRNEDGSYERLNATDTFLDEENGVRILDQAVFELESFISKLTNLEGFNDKCAEMRSDLEAVLAKYQRPKKS